jgi:hypothetical protein
VTYNNLRRDQPYRFYGICQPKAATVRPALAVIWVQLNLWTQFSPEIFPGAAQAAGVWGDAATWPSAVWFPSGPVPTLWRHQGMVNIHLYSWELVNEFPLLSLVGPKGQRFQRGSCISGQEYPFLESVGETFRLRMYMRSLFLFKGTMSRIMWVSLQKSKAPEHGLDLSKLRGANISKVTYWL